MVDEKPPLLQRPSQQDFLAEVLGDLSDLPAELPRRLTALVEETEDRSGAIRRLFEELSRG